MGSPDTETLPPDWISWARKDVGPFGVEEGTFEKIGISSREVRRLKAELVRKKPAGLIFFAAEYAGGLLRFQNWWGS